MALKLEELKWVTPQEGHESPYRHLLQWCTHRCLCGCITRFFQSIDVFLLLYGCHFPPKLGPFSFSDSLLQSFLIKLSVVEIHSLIQLFEASSSSFFIVLGNASCVVNCDICKLEQKILDNFHIIICVSTTVNHSFVAFRILLSWIH